jgi:hypothetical protein
VTAGNGSGYSNGKNWQIINNTGPREAELRDPIVVFVPEGFIL